MKRDYEIPYIENLTGDEKQVVIVAHGFDSSMKGPTAQMVLENLPKVGIGAIAFDFPAHGESPVEREFLSVENCIKDLEAVENYVREKCPQAEICYFGSSFGAYITMLYLSRYPEKSGKAFLRSAAVNMHTLFKNPTGDHNLFELYRPGNSKAMMIHGTCDEDIDYEVAKAFSEKFDIPLITVEGGDHRLSKEGMPEAVIMMAIEFYKEY